MQFSFDQPFIIVAAAIEHEGKYLLIQENHLPDKGKWNLPAGKLDMSEDPAMAVRREVQEETGLAFTPTYVVGVHSVVRSDVPGRSAPLHVLRLVFGGTTQGDVRLGAGDGSESNPEIAGYKWLTLEEIQQLPLGELRYHDIRQLIADHAAGVRYPLELVQHFTQG